MTTSLTEAEWLERLRTAAVRGAVVDLRTGDRDRDDSRHGDLWGPQRAIPAQAIIDACTVPPPDGGRLRRLVVVGARIVGRLDLSGLDVGCALTLTGCHFSDPVWFWEASLPSLRLSGSTLAAGMSASRSQIRGSLILSDGFLSSGELDLHRTHVGGVLDLSGARVSNPEGTALAADGITVGGGIFCRNGFRAEGQVRLIEAGVHGPLVLAPSSLHNPGRTAIVMDGATFHGGVFCTEGFELDGELHMIATLVRGPFVMTGGKLRNPGGTTIRADRAKFEGGLYMSDGFVAEGAICLIDAEVTSTWDLGGRLRNPGGDAITADRLRVGGNVTFDKGFVAEGRMQFVAATVQGQFVLFGRVVTRGGTALNLRAITVARELALVPSAPMTGGVDLSDARAGTLFDCDDAWTGGYRLRGLTYGSLDGRDVAAEAPAPARLSWLRGNYDGYHPQMYDQLATSYREAGDESRQRAVLVAKQRQRRRHLAPPARAWSVVEDLLVGYGYRTWRAIVPFALLLVVGLVFFGGNRDDFTPKSPSQHPAAFSPFAYTLDLLLPVVNLGQRDSWVAHDAAQMMAIGFIVIGWVLTTAIVTGLTGLVRRTS